MKTRLIYALVAWIYDDMCNMYLGLLCVDICMEYATYGDLYKLLPFINKNKIFSSITDTLINYKIYIFISSTILAPSGHRNQEEENMEGVLDKVLWVLTSIFYN
ncbi:hypothetical protein ACJX0J_005752, partial [Zea mays]